MPVDLIKLLPINLTYTHDLSKVDKDSKTVLSSWGLVQRTSDKQHNIVKDFTVPIEKNNLIYFYGYSGSGKSSILEYMSNNLPNVYYIKNYRDYLKEDLDAPITTMLIDFFKGVPYEDRLKLLGKCGLTEAWKYVTEIQYLSDGEKMRFVLYHVMLSMVRDQKTNPILIFDEFCSTLDRITAKVIAQNIRRIQQTLKERFLLDTTFILASAHDDLIEYLKADYVYFKEFYPIVKLKHNEPGTRISVETT